MKKHMDKYPTNTVEETKQAIIYACWDISQSTDINGIGIMGKAILNFHKRIKAVINSQGHHFEYKLKSDDWSEFDCNKCGQVHFCSSGKCFKCDQICAYLCAQKQPVSYEWNSLLLDQRAQWHDRSLEDASDLEEIMIRPEFDTDFYDSPIYSDIDYLYESLH